MVGALTVLLALSLLANAALLVRAARGRHRHVWEGWGDWMQDASIYGETRALRYRTCEGCGKVERQETGAHRCHVMYNNRAGTCPHLDRLRPGGRIARLEEDLGL